MLIDLLSYILVTIKTYEVLILSVAYSKTKAVLVLLWALTT